VKSSTVRDFTEGNEGAGANVFTAILELEHLRVYNSGVSHATLAQRWHWIWLNTDNQLGFGSSHGNALIF